MRLAFKEARQGGPHIFKEEHHLDMLYAEALCRGYFISDVLHYGVRR
jgi:hypothetical protein